MTLDQPIWLLLAIPLAVVCWRWPAPGWLLQSMRIAALALIVLALCGVRFTQPDRAGTVVVVADVSRSMPERALQQQREAIELMQQQMGPRDRLAVVTFAEGVAVERAPDRGAFDDFSQTLAPDASNMAQAMRRALSLIPSQRPGRVLVLSDGRWTGDDPQGVAGQAAGREIALDYRHLARPRVHDVAIERIEAPVRVDRGESFMLHAWVRAPGAQTVRVRLQRDDTVIAEGERDVAEGLTRLTFRDSADEAGTNHYQLHVDASGEASSGQQDPVPENNTAHRLVGIKGARPILLASDTPGGGFANLLGASGLDVTAKSPQNIDLSLVGLSNYRAVVMENVAARGFDAQGLENLAAWVEQSGGGLLMTGGRQSFGPGGYFQSPIDPVLPVSMELRQEHRKLSLALAVVMDRSGSMSMTVDTGQSKMDLANLAAAQVYDLLSPMDQFGVIAVDSQAHQIAPLHHVGDDPNVRNKVLRIQSRGGGIYVYEALSAGVDMLSAAEAETRHIILFSDAQDSVQPRTYKALLEKARQANITVSVIGLGTEQDRYAPLLKDIAQRGGGRVYFTNDATRLPQLFAQDTFVVARSTFLSEPTPVQTTAAMPALTGQPFNDPPPAGGYNLTYLRDGAQLASVTQDDYQAPFVATWQAGIGRAAAYTGEVDGEFTGPIGQWPRLGEMLTSLVRWTAGERSALHEDMMLTQHLQRGRYTIRLHVRPERAGTLLSARPEVITLRSKPGEAPTPHRQTMQWESPATLVATLNLSGRETALSTVDVADGVAEHGRVTLAPVRLPYSPEFSPPRADRGEPALRRLADVTGGRQRTELGTIWRDLPEMPQSIAITHWLLIAAVVLVLLEVFQRRTGMLSALSLLMPPWRRRQRAAAAAQAPTQSPDTQQPQQPQQPQQAPQPAAPQRDTKTSEPAAPAQPTGSISDALSQARNRAAQRTRKRDQ